MIEVLRALWPYLRPRRWLVALVGGAMLMEVVTALAMPWPMKMLFDRILFRHTPSGGLKLRTTFPPSTEHQLYLIVGLVVVLGVADALFTWVDTYVSERISQRAVYDLRRDLFNHLQQLSVSFHGHADTRVGDLLSRLSGDIGSLQDLAAGGVSNVVTNGLTLAVMSALMLYLDPQLALVAFVGIIPMVISSRRTTGRMREAMRQARRQEGRVSSFLQESLSSIKLVQAYGREEHEAKRLDEANSRSLEANLAAAGMMSRLAPSMTVLSSITTALIMLVGVHQVLGRHATPGELLLFVSYSRAMQSPIRQLAKLSYSVTKANAGLERIQEVLDRKPGVTNSPEARPAIPGRGDVVFRDVSFGYEPDHPILRGVDLAVPGGCTVALVGATGAGKSTLLSLLPRFYDVQGGQILLDGVDIRDLQLSSLRSQLALVLQDTLIFRMSIRDNIAYGRPDATDAEIWEAASAAGVDLVASRFADGIDTVVSERGSTLSGGEKQCIGIARALLKNAPVVLLDEPTSAMDTRTEQTVMGGFDRLLMGRTVLVIAHRLSTVLKSDYVAVLAEGRIVEYGPPELLLSDTTSHFHDLARRQHLLSDSSASVATTSHERLVQGRAAHP